MLHIFQDWANNIKAGEFQNQANMVEITNITGNISQKPKKPDLQNMPRYEL